MIASSSVSSIDYAANLRRLMAREGLTLAELARRSRLHYRTLKDVLAGGHRPRSRTLNRLAAGLKVPIEELFQDPALLRHRLFDRQANPAVEEVVASHPRLFHGWTADEFDELYSRFGTGGSLRPDGTLEVVRAMNRRREILAKVTLLLETSEAELLESIVEQLHRRAVVVAPNSKDPPNNADAGSRLKCPESQFCR